MVQVAVFARLMAQITSHSLGHEVKATSGLHVSTNVHLYENQIDLMMEQVKREPFPSPQLHINPDIKTLKDLETRVTLDDFELVNYQHHDPIKYPFTV